MTNNDYFEVYKCNQLNTMALNTSYTRCNLLSNHFLPFFGSCQISEMNANHIIFLYDKAEHCGLSENSILGLYAALLSYFKDAINYSLISENPVSSAPARKPYYNGI